MLKDQGLCICCGRKKLYTKYRCRECAKKAVEATQRCRQRKNGKNVPNKKVKLLTYNGITQTQAQWAREIGITSETLRWRIIRNNNVFDKTCVRPHSWGKD